MFLHKAQSMAQRHPANDEGTVGGDEVRRLTVLLGVGEAVENLNEQLIQCLEDLCAKEQFIESLEGQLRSYLHFPFPSQALIDTPDMYLNSRLSLINNKYCTKNM